MAEPLTYRDIEQEFNESLGYIQNDIENIRQIENSVNYTLALLIGCGCEVLAAGRGDRDGPHRVLAELLDGDWKLLAKPLFEALRNGLAHSFDMKHLRIGEQDFQIYLDWYTPRLFDIWPHGPHIGVRILAQRLYKKIDEFRSHLEKNAAARVTFRAACEYQDFTGANKDETAAWDRLVAAYGVVVNPVTKPVSR